MRSDKPEQRPPVIGRRAGKDMRRKILDTERRDGNAARALRRPGGHSEGATPDPIPNSVVKTLCADGTAS